MARTPLARVGQLWPAQTYARPSLCHYQPDRVLNWTEDTREARKALRMNDARWASTGGAAVARVLEQWNDLERIDLGACTREELRIGNGGYERLRAKIGQLTERRPELGQFSRELGEESGPSRFCPRLRQIAMGRTTGLPCLREESRWCASTAPCTCA